MNLRTGLVLAGLVLVASSLHAQESIPSRLVAATVFLEGAQVIREAEAPIPAGTHTLRFAGLTPHLDPASIRLEATGSFTILSFDHTVAPNPDPELMRQREALQMRRSIKADSVALEERFLEIIRIEEQFVVASLNQKSADNAPRVTVAEVQQAAEFMRTRLTEVKLRQLRAEKRLVALRIDLAEIDRKLAEVNDQMARSKESLLAVTVQAAQATRGTFRLGYLVPQASWVPRYDLRVRDVASPVELVYHARIQQQSGEAWDNVQLTLSTGNPAVSGNRPTLDPWWLAFWEPRPLRERAMQRVGSEKAFEAQEVVVVEDQAAPASEPEASFVQTQVAEHTTTVSFEIEAPFSLPSDGRVRSVEIDRHRIPADYEYTVIPKLNPTAFLTARVTAWQDYYLLPGEASLFFENTFIGASWLDAGATGDTLVVSLGPDRSLAVERTRLEEFTRRNFSGSKTTEARGFQIAVRNNKRQAVTLVVEDQVPVSTNEAIEVRVDELLRGTHDAQTGTLRWKLTLPPGGSETVRFGYEVRYPKDRRIILE
jgi:uncharacterized protein (TIGR02231 family)